MYIDNTYHLTVFLPISTLILLFAPLHFDSLLILDSYPIDTLSPTQPEHQSPFPLCNKQHFCTCQHLFPFLQRAVFLSLPPLLSMLQAFTTPSPATPKEHPRLPLVRYPSTQRCSSDRDSSRRTIRRTSGAQADGRAVHKQADERRISDASAMHQRCTRDRATARRTNRRAMDQRWTSDARATEQHPDQRWTSKPRTTTRADP